jgi:hypothetical protein
MPYMAHDKHAAKQANRRQAITQAAHVQMQVLAVSATVTNGMPAAAEQSITWRANTIPVDNMATPKLCHSFSGRCRASAY